VPEAHRPNVWRSKAAGRIQSGDEHWTHRDSAKVAKGEQRYWNAKLTAEQVAEIRDRYKAGGISQQKLGDEFGVGQGAIQRIVSGKNWKE
jgi:hypothetical protein